jgi:hypothetical protein
MANEIDQLQAAADEAAQAVSPPSITDCAPGPATTIAGKPACHICAGVLRICETVRRAVERRDGPMSDQDAGYLIVYLRLRAADVAAQMELWQAARRPLTLYGEFVEWMFATPVTEFMAAAQESSEGLEELNRVGNIIGDGDDENPTTAGVTGSP